MKISDFIPLLTAQKKTFACLIGEKTDYSLSPLMHNSSASYHKLDFNYFGLDVKKDEFSLINEVLSHPLCKGINITIPYKNRILDFIDVQDDLVQGLNAANVVFKKDGKLLATNTDVSGFQYPLKKMIDFKSVKTAFIFGSGGASRAAKFGLKKMGINDAFIVSRNPKENDLSYSNWIDSVKPKEAILVNGSPLGMTSLKNESPISLQQLEKVSPLICYHLIYKPAETLFLSHAKSLGFKTINGLEMLIKQGSESFKIWNGLDFPFEKIKLDCIEHLKND